MKKYYLMLLSVILLSTCWMSCSKDDAPKMISPVETDFVSGGLSKLIEVVNEPCELKMVVRDDAIASQIFQLKVKLKLKKESPALQSIDAQDISFTELLSVATITLEDINGTKVQEISVRSEELLKLKKLLQTKEGTEAEIVFEETFNNSKDAPKWYEQTTQFRPYLTAEVVGGSNANGSYDANPALQCAVINDADGWTNVRTQPSMNGAIVTKIYDGERFYFERVPGSNWVKVYRTADDTQSIGFMHGSRVMPVSGAADMNADMNNESGNVTSDIDVSGENWDELLDSYERYVDKLISCMRKIESGDMSMMEEYYRLLQESERLSNKMEKAKGMMTSSQQERYMRILKKMMQESQKMSGTY